MNLSWRAFHICICWVNETRTQIVAQFVEIGQKNPDMGKWNAECLTGELIRSRSQDCALLVIVLRQGA